MCTYVRKKIAILARRKQSSPSGISCNPAKLPATCMRPSFPTCFLANTCRILMATLKKSSAIAHCMSYIYSIETFALWNRLKRKRKATPNGLKGIQKKIEKVRTGTFSSEFYGYFPVPSHFSLGAARPAKMLTRKSKVWRI